MTCLRPSSAQHIVGARCPSPSNTCLISWMNKLISIRSMTMMSGTPGRVTGNGERGSGTGANGVTAPHTSSPFPQGAEICLWLSLEVIQDKRGPYLCDLGVGKSLACLLQQKKSQECNAPSACTSPDPRQHAPPDGWSWLSAVLLPPHLEQTLLGLLCPRGSSRDASPDSHLGCSRGVCRVPPVTQPSVP